MSVENTWEKFLEYPFCGEIRRVFANLEFNSLDRITSCSALELMCYRGIGQVGLLEVRLALARLNLSLRDEPVYSPRHFRGVNELKEQLCELWQKHDEILREIRTVKTKIREQRRSRRKTPVNPELDGRILARWKELRDYKAVAQELGVSPRKVSIVVHRQLT